MRLLRYQPPHQNAYGCLVRHSTQVGSTIDIQCSSVDISGAPPLFHVITEALGKSLGRKKIFHIKLTPINAPCNAFIDEVFYERTIPTDNNLVKFRS